MRALLLSLVLIVPVAASVAGAQDSPPQSDWMVHISLSDGKWSYIPRELLLVPGGIVQLMVYGNGQHSLTLDMPGFDADIPTTEGMVRVAEFRAPMAEGKYPFRNKYHPEATGVLTVQQRVAEAPPPPTIGVVPGGYESKFDPATLEVAPGSEIIFRDNGSFGHNLESIEPGLFSAGDLKPGEERSFVAPAAVGEYAFRCKFHESLGMTGSLIVKEGAPGSPPRSPAGAEPVPATQVTTSVEGVDIELADNEFRPLRLAVEPGQVLTLKNTGATPHTFTASDKSFDLDRLDPGESKTFTVPSTSTGDIAYYCKYHASSTSKPGDAMAAVLAVGGASATPAPGATPKAETPIGGLALLLGALALGAIAVRRRQ